MGHEAMRIAVDDSAFPSHADGGQNVVACAHDIPNSGFIQLFDDLGGDFLEFVFEDDEPD
jgi:hypothetical protein